jgi:hypothetical protein
MEQEEDKVVAFKMVADLVEDEVHRCEVRPELVKNTVVITDGPLDNWVSQVTYGGDGLQI